jgi:hypothetical protein
MPKITASTGPTGTGAPAPSESTQFLRQDGTYQPVLQAVNDLSDVQNPVTAYGNISPMTTKGDLEYESAPGVASRLAVGSAGQVLGVSGGAPAWQAGMGLQAATAAAGYALADGTGAILAWTVPNDGQLHQFLVFPWLTVASTETGGELAIAFTTPGGSAVTEQFAAGGLAAADYGAAYFSFTQVPVKAGTTVTISQFTALTGGAATLWAALWGS